jgi:hypothetical protein
MRQNDPNHVVINVCNDWVTQPEQHEMPDKVLVVTPRWKGCQRATTDGTS